MMMPYLHCSATDCSNNKNLFCCRPSIDVQGSGAVSSLDTLCYNFVEKGRSFTSSTHFTETNDFLDVACSAQNCVHNDSGQCYAEKIAIDSRLSGAECGTFRM